MKKIRKVGFFVNTTKANAADVVKGVSTWLKERNIVSLLSAEQAVALGQPQTGLSKTEVVEQADVLSRPGWRWDIAKRGPYTTD